MPDPIAEYLGELRVLIVDDHDETRTLIRRMLNDMGLTHVFAANSGHDAMQVLDSAAGGEIIHLILCDWTMPGMSGLQLLQQVRTLDPDMPFIMVTGRADQEAVTEARAHGVTGYIVKPFSPAVLYRKIAIVAQLVAKRQKHGLRLVGGPTPNRLTRRLEVP